MISQRWKQGLKVFSQTQEYALRAIVWLAQHIELGPVGNETIARETRVPPSYLAKVMQQLVESKILSSRRGVGGGFQLIRDMDSLTVLEVINAVDPIRRITDCPLGLKTHRQKRCPMHARLDDSLGLVEDTLRNSTIREMLHEKGRPQPLVETPLAGCEEKSSKPSRR